MTYPENEFGDFEEDFKNAEKAAQGGATGVVPDGPYKVVCTSVDVNGDGQAVDKQIVKASTTGSKGLKIFLEILEPAEVKDPVTDKMVKTKGEIIEHVFWITQANLRYLKRDVETILGRPPKSLAELKEIVWLGKTCEVGLRAEIYRGFKSSKVNYFNAWAPGKAAQEAAGKTSAKKAAAGKPAAAAPATAETKGGDPSGDPDF